MEAGNPSSGRILHMKAEDRVELTALALAGVVFGAVCAEVLPAPGGAAWSLQSGTGTDAIERPRWIAVPVAPRPFPKDDRGELAERLYGWNCMPCHGAEGKGDGPMATRLGLEPRDFTRGTFKLKTSVPGEMPFDVDLFRTISNGFPGGAMRGFADFTVEERWSLVDYVQSLARRTSPAGRIVRWFEAYPARTPVQGPPDSRGGDAVRGGSLFQGAAQCSRCHGERGNGNGPAAQGLRDAEDRPVPLPEFAQGRLSFKAGSRPEDVYRVLATGMSGTAMPSFESLSPKDRWDLAAFVCQLQKPIAPGAVFFQTRGCIQCHSLGKGRRAGPDLLGVSHRRDREWLSRWLEDPPFMLATDPQARSMGKEYPVKMPNLHLSPSEVSELLEYLGSLRDASGK